LVASDPQPDLGAIARQVIEANLYMTLATADETGRPWVSPVWFAYAPGYAEFFWVSSPEASHSQNIAGRPEVAIVVFDSRVPAGTGQGVYMAAEARELADAELERGIDVFSRRSEAHGARRWNPEDVRAPALHRLYRAAASQHWILDPAGHPVHGSGRDHRTPVTP
jgi:nitroimidazol reductase NimA-like FMN-containing flavoprotein (pyridoxamine 5'-phosphate oxidase superfamily)